MISQIRSFVKHRPQLYDISIRTKRALGWKTPSYEFFDKFSKTHNRNVNFIQIGANDGLRNDPIREFVIRDRWTGILVEPLPGIFAQLKENYSRVKGSRLLYVNAAISTSNSGYTSFWTFDDKFLAALSYEERMAYLRKSSMSKDRLTKFLKGHGYLSDEVLKEVKVPCMTLRQLVQRYWIGRNVDLLIIDAEGSDGAILAGMDFEILNPSAIFFETMHLGRNENQVFDLLTKNKYKLYKAHGDAIADRSGLI